MPRIVAIRMRKNEPHFIEYHVVTDTHPEGRWKYVTDLPARKMYDKKLFGMLLPFVSDEQRVKAGVAA